jgi:AcrR family transcriptional regulator
MAMEINKDTKTRILEVAERLFAEHGAEKATLRKICAAAEVNLAAVNYHFGSKGELINALLSHILGHVVEVQITLLDQAEQRAGETPPRLEEVIHSFLAPIFSMARKYPNMRELFENLSKAYGDITRFRSHIMAMLQKVHRRYMAVFTRMLPDLTQTQVLYRYAFLWASTHDIVDQWLREDLQVIFAQDLGLSETMLEEMVRFMAAGFRTGRARIVTRPVTL